MPWFIKILTLISLKNISQNAMFFTVIHNLFTANILEMREKGCLYPPDEAGVLLPGKKYLYWHIFSINIGLCSGKPKHNSASERFLLCLYKKCILQQLQCIMFSLAYLFLFRYVRKWTKVGQEWDILFALYKISQIC